MMMRALIGVMVGLMFGVGCAFEHGSVGAGDDDGLGSGSEESPDLDSDGDGLVDRVDNCATVGNLDQRDHDDDGRGDPCDACPHLPDTAKDTDLDGVGDACDPRPTTAGDRLAFFEGFYTSVAWKAVIGSNSWQHAEGMIRQAKLDAPYQLVRDDNPNLNNVFVDARVRINAISPNVAVRRSSGLVLGYGDPNHYFFCGLAALPQGAEVNAGEVSTDFFGTPRYDYMPGEFDAQMSGDWLTIHASTEQLDGVTRIKCLTYRPGVNPGQAQFDADADAPGDVGIRTNGTDASFDYVFVVEVPAS